MGAVLIFVGVFALLALAASAAWQLIAWWRLSEGDRVKQRAIRDADLVVHRASREYKRRTSRAERQVTRAATAPRRAKYGSLELFDDHVRSGSQSFPLTAKTKAKVVGHGRGDQRNVMVLLEDTSWSRSLKFTKIGKPNELSAQAFVSETRVCAANAVTNRARRQQTVDAARQQASSVAADTAAVESARAARAELGERLPASGHAPGRRWRRAAAPLAVVLLIVGGALSPTAKQGQGDAAAAPQTPAEQVAVLPTVDRSAARAKARRLVSYGDYAGAQRAVQDLAAADRSYVRRIASNRAARVTQNALRRDDRSAARRALTAADSLPHTAALRVAAARYDAAVREASRLRRERADAAAVAKRQRAAARRAAVAAAATETGASDDAGDFCSSHSCIDNFDNGRGSIVQCADGMWSKSGGISGACSRHGGVG